MKKQRIGLCLAASILTFSGLLGCGSVEENSALTYESAGFYTIVSMGTEYGEIEGRELTLLGVGNQYLYLEKGGSGICFNGISELPLAWSDGVVRINDGDENAFVVAEGILTLTMPDGTMCVYTYVGETPPKADPEGMPAICEAWFMDFHAEVTACEPKSIDGEQIFEVSYTLINDIDESISSEIITIRASQNNEELQKYGDEHGREAKEQKQIPPGEEVEASVSFIYTPGNGAVTVTFTDGEMERGFTLNPDEVFR